MFSLNSSDKRKRGRGQKTPNAVGLSEKQMRLRKRNRIRDSTDEGGHNKSSLVDNKRASHKLS